MDATQWALVKRVFQGALDRPAAERTAFVRTECGSDVALRAEVESLLVAHDQAGSFADRSAVAWPESAEAESVAFTSSIHRLRPGERFGAYEIRSFLAAGGMGEVYRAHDATLDREVAIKILPATFSSVPERLARFEREARVLASVNHPNIAAIYGVERVDEFRGLILELVEGETLGERLAHRRPSKTQAVGLSIREALEIARQIAYALDAAHSKGIVHRDLKPGNLKITPTGVVKVLDFGLAKADGGADSMNSPTAAATLTGEGLVVGTAPYMSPEQARGQSVDKRTDIWAFGCVVFEMLTGIPPFRGATVSDTIARVLEREVDWAALPSNTPVAIHRLLRRCLAKDLSRRLSHIGDARLEIDDALEALAEETATTSVAPPAMSHPAPVVSIARIWRRPYVLGAVVLSFGLLVAGVTTWYAQLPSPQPVTHAVINLPPGQQLAESNQPVIALSPDGRQLTYVGIQGGVQRLYLRPMESPTARPVEGTEGGHTPFFSPDGQWLGFFAGGLLKKVSVNGGAPIALAEAAQPGGATWSSKGVIVFEPAPGPLHQVSDSGGEKRTLTRLADGETTHFLPTFLPDADTVLFNAGPPTRLTVYSLSTGERRDLLHDAMQPRHISTGHVVYGAAGTLMAVPFDSERLQLAGTAVPVVEDVRQSKFNGVLQFSISSTGTLAYVSGGAAANQSRLVWVDRRGTAQRLVAPVRGYRNPKLSPNGLRVALGIDDLGSQTWVYDLARETLTRLTFEGRNNDNPIWTPNGQRIAFSSNRDGVPNVFWQPSDGSGEMEPLTTSGSAQLPLAFSPDGQTLAFRYAPRTNNDIWMLRMSDRDVQPFFESPSLEVVAEFSPDGHWLAYVSDETGRWEVFVRPYPGPGGKRQVSTEGGTEPVWNRNGRELFFRSADKMMVVQVTTQGGFSAATPRVLFEGPYRLSPGTLANYDVAPDGERFLMVEPVGQADSAATQINVVQNWLEELKRLVPVD